METKITVELTFDGKNKLSKSKIWEAIDELIQNETIEINDSEYTITVEKV